MTEKKTRKMSPRGFLAKTNTKAALTVKSFLDSYREYLTTGEVSYSTKLIVEKLDNGEILPTPALNEIKAAVLAHILEVERIKAEESIENSSKNSSPGTKKHFQAKIIDAATGEVAQRVKDDGEVEELVKGFDLPQDAERWVDRRLFDGSPSWYGVVKHLTAKNKERDTDIINRDDSIARILKKPGKPVTKSPKFSSNQLGWGVKVRESAIRFSRG
jgi:hypothetical protein